MRQSWIRGYGCVSAAGRDVSSLWDALQQGTDCSRPIEAGLFPDVGRVPPPVRAYFTEATIDAASHKDSSQLEVLIRNLVQAWEQIGSPGDLPRLGVILASTKGCLDDFIWTANEVVARTSPDPLTPVLDGFLSRTKIRPALKTVVSNACASSLSALWLAQKWISSENVDHVLVIAADRVAPFVAYGFHSLQALTLNKLTSFDARRAGLLLGEASAAILLSKDQGSFLLDGVGIDAEGVAATRPSNSGESLKQSYASYAQTTGAAPDLIIAHGTATVINDAAEDRAFSTLFGRGPAITATKGTIGHTLGASGAIDSIVACEILRHQKAFAIPNTEVIDPRFECRYLTKDSLEVHGPKKINRVLVSSLGFGGVHATAVISNGKLC